MGMLLKRHRDRENVSYTAPTDKLVEVVEDSKEPVKKTKKTN